MAKRVLPKGYKKKAEAEASASDVEEVREEGNEPAAEPTVFEKKTKTMEATPALRVAAIPTGEAELVSNAPDLRALDADISAFECLDFEVRGGAEGAERFAKHLADITRAVAEASVSAADAEVLKDRLVLSRQLSFVSVKLGLTGLIYNTNAVESVFTRSNADLEELKARALGIMQTGVDCGQHLQPEVRRHLAQLVQKIEAELAKPERAKPAKQPCAGPEQWPEGKPSTTELDQAVDSLGVDPGAATVAAPAEGAPIPLVVQKDDGSEQWATGVHEAVPMTGVFVSPSCATKEMTTKAIRTPLPPPPEPNAALIEPFDAAVAEAKALADQRLAEVASAPPAGPAHPEPEPQADPALAHTEAAIPATPPKGVPATAPLRGMIRQTQVESPTGDATAKPAVEFTFHIYQGSVLQRTQRLAQQIIKVGKLPSSHLRLDDEKVSRMHAVIETKDGGEVEIIDLGSAVGTLVNGGRVNKCTLCSGDALQFGDTRVRIVFNQVQTAAPAHEPPPPPPKGVATTAPLGGQIGQTMVGNPTGSQPAVAPIEPPPPAAPPPDQNDGLDEVAKLVAAYIVAPVTERLKGEHRQNYRTISSILNIEVKSEKPAVAERARELKTLLETAYQIAEFANKVDVILPVNGSVDSLSSLPDDLVTTRITKARDFMGNRDADPLTPQMTKLVIAFITKYEEALGRKLNPHPTPDPAVPHGPGSRPAMPIPAPNLTPAATPQAKAAAAAPPPKSEAPTGLAPAVAPPAPAAPLPTPVIKTPPPSQESVMLSPSIAPPAPTASPYSVLVGGAAVRPGNQVMIGESVEAKAKREKAERSAMIAKYSKYAFYAAVGLASVFIAIVAIKMTGPVTRWVDHEITQDQREEAERNKLTDLIVRQASIALERQTRASADAAAAAARQQQHASTQNGGLRCSPAGQRSECSNLPPDTHQSPTGPGYYCPQDAPMTPMGSGGYNACHCQWCQ